MSNKTKIVVLHFKELIYTVIFLILAIVLILLLVFMFHPGRDKDNTVETATYVAGVYTSTIQLQDQNIDVQVVVDENHINSISLVNLDESIATMYPLMQNCLDNISQQIYQNQSVDRITYSDENQYTSTILVNAIRSAIEKAKTENQAEQQIEQQIEPEQDTNNEGM